MATRDEIGTALRDEEIRRSFVATRVSFVLESIGFIGFGFVDRLLTDAHWAELVMARAASICCLAVVAALTFVPNAKRFGLMLGWAIAMVGGIGIIVVTALAGGGNIDYYIMLVVLYFAYATLIPSTTLMGVAFVALLSVSYAFSMAMLDLEGPAGKFAVSLAVLSITSCITVAALILNNKMREGRFRLDFTLRRAHERLKELDAAKNQFFANISHELRTPLTLIIASTESLRESMEARGEKVPQDLVACRRNGIRLLREVDELLELSKLESPTARRRIRQFDLAAMVRELVLQLQPLAARRDVALRTDIALPGEAPIEADDTQIERVWLNLAANAIKFSSEGGSVTFGLRENGPDAYEGWVQDTGDGIPPEALGKIFDRFFQAPVQNGRPRSGAGLGLSLVRRIIEVHRGRVAAFSVLGEGTRIEFVLPRVATEVQEDRVERRGEQVLASSERRRGQGLAEWDGVLREKDEYRFWKIEEATERRSVTRRADAARGPTLLLVDDNGDVLELLAGVLGGSYQLITATDGEEGLAQARRLRPDLILSDVMMPKMSGLALLAAVRADPELRNVPVVLLTASGQEEDRIAASEGGADAYLAKPFHPQELRTTIKNILRKQQAQAAAVIDERALALRVMAEGVAHDVLNPLGFVRGALLILSRLVAESVEIIGTQHERGREIAAEGEEFFKSGDEGLQRAIAAIGELRRFSRGDTSSQVARIDVNDVARRTVSVAATQGKVVPHLGAKHPVALRSGQLEQVLLNLVLNAQQAAGFDQEVNVTTWDDEPTRTVNIAVRDAGPGMDRSTLQRVFDPYFTTKEMGTGLGLTVSRQIVRDGGGTLSVESQAGQGSTFTITLPRFSEAGSQGQPAALQ